MNTGFVYEVAHGQTVLGVVCAKQEIADRIECNRRGCCCCYSLVNQPRLSYPIGSIQSYYCS